MRMGLGFEGLSILLKPAKFRDVARGKTVDEQLRLFHLAREEAVSEFNNEITAFNKRQLDVARQMECEDQAKPIALITDTGSVVKASEYTVTLRDGSKITAVAIEGYRRETLCGNLNSIPLNVFLTEAQESTIRDRAIKAFLRVKYHVDQISIEAAFAQQIGAEFELDRQGNYVLYACNCDKCKREEKRHLDSLNAKPKIAKY